jgi:hypothetical protein
MRSIRAQVCVPAKRGGYQWRCPPHCLGLPHPCPTPPFTSMSPYYTTSASSVHKPPTRCWTPQSRGRRDAPPCRPR